MLYFIRHGQTDYNLRIAAGEIAREDDSPLNQTGVRQSEEVAQIMKDKKVDFILASPYVRALHTAKIINQYHGLPILKDLDLRERDGGGVAADIWHDSFDFDKNIEFDGESVTEFFERIYALLGRIKKNFRDKEIVIVSHGGVHHGFYAYFNNLSWHGNLRIDEPPNCSIRQYSFDQPI